MKASEIVQGLPEQNTPERERMIISAIGMGNYIAPAMAEITSSFNGHTATMSVMADALMVGEPDDFLRINATMAGEQEIADMLCMSLITSKIADLIWTCAGIKIEPCLQTADAQMANTSRMVKHSAAVTQKISAASGISAEEIAVGAAGLVADVGKDWVLSNKLYNRPDLAANYGWHTKAKPSSPSSGPYKCPGGGYMWQTLGTAHNAKHVDYSQVVRLMSKQMVVDGSPMWLEDVAASSELCGLVSYEGPLKVLRHPG